jgi:hypothetical protein
MFVFVPSSSHSHICTGEAYISFCNTNCSHGPPIQDLATMHDIDRPKYCLRSHIKMHRAFFRSTECQNKVGE